MVWYLESVPKPMFYIEKVDAIPVDHTHSRVSHRPRWVSYAKENPTEDNPLFEEYIPELVYVQMLNNHANVTDEGANDVDDGDAFPGNDEESGMEVQVLVLKKRQ